jgi:molecular chaperone GrpE
LAPVNKEAFGNMTTEKQTPGIREETAAAAPEAEPLPADTMESLQARLLQADEKIRELNDAWLRAKAETENVRRRAEDEAAKVAKFALEDFAKALLPVKDSLEAALATANASAGQVRGGVEVTLKQLAQVLEREKVREINPMGERFDPHLHQAIAAVPADGDPNRVLEVLQKGYALHDRVLRPALVSVSRPKES